MGLVLARMWNNFYITESILCSQCGNKIADIGDSELRDDKTEEDLEELERDFIGVMV